MYIYVHICTVYCTYMYCIHLYVHICTYQDIFVRYVRPNGFTAQISTQPASTVPKMPLAPFQRWKHLLLKIADLCHLVYRCQAIESRLHSSREIISRYLTLSGRTLLANETTAAISESGDMPTSGEHEAIGQSTWLLSAVPRLPSEVVETTGVNR